MQRKATKQSRGPNSKEADFQAWLKQQLCCVSGVWGVHVHHCVGSSVKHNKVYIGHYFCIPLSEEKHREYHNGTKAFREKYGSQSSLWVSLCAQYYDETGILIPDDVHHAIMTCGK